MHFRVRFCLFATMCVLLCVVLFGFSVWTKCSTDDGAGRLHYFCALSAILDLLTQLVCLHAFVNSTGFLLWLFHSTCHCCSGFRVLLCHLFRGGFNSVDVVKHSVGSGD